MKKFVSEVHNNSSSRNLKLAGAVDNENGFSKSKFIN